MSTAIAYTLIDAIIVLLWTGFPITHLYLLWLWVVTAAVVGVVRVIEAYASK